MERQRAKAAAVAAYTEQGAFVQGNALYREDAPRASVNIMADKRVARGSTFSVSVVPPVRRAAGAGGVRRDREKSAFADTHTKHHTHTPRLCRASPRRSNENSAKQTTSESGGRRCWRSALGRRRLARLSAPPPSRAGSTR